MGYDPTTDIGKVRLLISDVGGESGTDFIFDDPEIEAFLEMESGVKLAAASALRSIANNTAQVMKVIKFMELSTNGAETAKILLKSAEELEKRADEDDDGSISIIEMNLGPFSDRELARNAWRRG